MPRPSGKAWMCDGCGKLFAWSDKASWYGSLKDQEREAWRRVWIACSDECADKKPSRISEYPHAFDYWGCCNFDPMRLGRHRTAGDLEPRR